MAPMDWVVLQSADEAADASLRPGGEGLLHAAAVGHTAGQSLHRFADTPDADPWRSTRRPPAELRVSKENYDRSGASRSKKAFQRWMPHLTVEDAMRLVAGETRIRRECKPGFDLDDELLGLTATTGSGHAVVYGHPDRLDQGVKAHQHRPLAIAAYLHSVACHELTHVDGRLTKGHSGEIFSAREDLGHATGHLVPAIAVLVQEVLALR